MALAMLFLSACGGSAGSTGSATTATSPTVASLTAVAEQLFPLIAQYNYYTGQLLKSFNLRPNSSTEEQVVTTTYDFADRPLQTTQPNGGYVRTAYWDNFLLLFFSPECESPSDNHLHE